MAFIKKFRPIHALRKFRLTHSPNEAFFVPRDSASSENIFLFGLGPIMLPLLLFVLLGPIFALLGFPAMNALPLAAFLGWGLIYPIYCMWKSTDSGVDDLMRAQTQLAKLASLVKDPLLEEDVSLKLLVSDLTDLLIDRGFKVAKLDKRLKKTLSSYEHRKVVGEIKILLDDLKVISEALIKVEKMLVSAQRFQQESQEALPEDEDFSSLAKLETILSRIEEVSDRTEAFDNASRSLKSKPGLKRALKERV